MTEKKLWRESIFKFFENSKKAGVLDDDDSIPERFTSFKILDSKLVLPGDVPTISKMKEFLQRHEYYSMICGGATAKHGARSTSSKEASRRCYHWSKDRQRRGQYNGAESVHRASTRRYSPTIKIRGKRVTIKRLTYVWFVDPQRVMESQRLGKTIRVSTTCGDITCVSPYHLATTVLQSKAASCPFPVEMETRTVTTVNTKSGRIVREPLLSLTNDSGYAINTDVWNDGTEDAFFRSICNKEEQSARHSNNPTKPTKPTKPPSPPPGALILRNNDYPCKKIRRGRHVESTEDRIQFAHRGEDSEDSEGDTRVSHGKYKVETGVHAVVQMRPPPPSPPAPGYAIAGMDSEDSDWYSDDAGCTSAMEGEEAMYDVRLGGLLGDGDGDGEQEGDKHESPQKYVQKDIDRAIMKKRIKATLETRLQVMNYLSPELFGEIDITEAYINSVLVT